MKYSTNWLLNAIEKEEKRFKFLCFWGHQPSKDGSVNKFCLSQWWVQDFIVEGQIYPTAEHWMMAGKAKLFGDNEVLEKIYQAKTPAEAKKLGRQVRNFDGQLWNAHKYNIVKEGNIHKFSQHEELKTFLLNTKDRVLVEASPVDKIWGIGLEASHPHAEQPMHWKGENLLGFAIMEARDHL